jgi:hypothetical protein
MSGVEIVGFLVLRLLVIWLLLLPFHFVSASCPTIPLD